MEVLQRYTKDMQDIRLMLVLESLCSRVLRSVHHYLYAIYSPSRLGLKLITKQRRLLCNVHVVQHAPIAVRSGSPLLHCQCTVAWHQAKRRIVSRVLP